MKDQAEAIERIVRQDHEPRARMQAEARATAHGLIQGYLGPDHKVMHMPGFYGALVQALIAAREQGQVDASGNIGSL
jgi:hypothetical protein